MFLFHRGFIKHLFAKGKSFVLLFPVLPNEYSPSWWVFSYSGNQLNIHIDTYIQYIQTQKSTHTFHILSPMHVEKFNTRLRPAPLHLCLLFKCEKLVFFGGNLISYQYLKLLLCIGFYV